MPRTWCTCNNITSAFAIGIIPLFKSNLLILCLLFSQLLNRTKIHKYIISFVVHK